MRGKWLVCLWVLVWGCQSERSRDIVAPGMVAGDVITVKSLVVGNAQAIPVKEGERIEKGALLLKIDGAKILKQMEELKIIRQEIDEKKGVAQTKIVFLTDYVTYLKKQVERFQRLQQAESIAGENLESMELKLKEAESNLFELKKGLLLLAIELEKLAVREDLLRLNYQDFQIISPVNGLVLSCFVTSGENVFPNTAIMDILDPESIYVDIYVEEKEMAFLQIRQKVKIIMDGLEDREFSGFISFFGHKAEFSPKYVISQKERKSLLYQVRIKPDKDFSAYKIGMPVTVVMAKIKPV